MSRATALMRQLMRFGAVGSVGFVVDVALFNLLLLVGTSSHLHGAAVLAKVVSTAAAIAVNWLGNRYWTFRDVRRADVAREAVEFAIVSILGSAVTLACLGFTHYVLHLTSPLADNISANVVGLALGSAVRFVAYRGWVFATSRSSAHVPESVLG